MAFEPQSLLELFSILVTTAALFGWVSKRWLKLPLTIGTMLLTVVASTILLLFSHRVPAVHHWAMHLVGAINFEDLILHGMLALLLFAGSVLLDLKALAKEKLAVTILSLPGTLLSTFATAAIVRYLLPAIGMHVPWLQCLFFGALISPTDPIAVLEMLRRVGVPKNIQAQLAGESLFNDGVGAVLFIALLEAARGATPTPLHVISFLVIKAGGGLLFGIACAWVTSVLMRTIEAYEVDILLSIALAVGSYALADRLHLSAPLTSVAAGIAIRLFNRNYSHPQIAHESLDRFWEVIDEIQNAILFVLLGLEILAIPFARLSVEAGALAIATVTLVRLAVVAAMLSLVRLLQPTHRSSIRTLTWGGLRGSLSLALALSVPKDQGREWMLVATYSVVLFSILFQGVSMGPFLRKLGNFSPPAI